MIHWETALSFLEDFLDMVGDLLPPDRNQIGALLEELEASPEDGTEEEQAASDLIYSMIREFKPSLMDMVKKLEKGPSELNKQLLIAFVKKLITEAAGCLHASTKQNALAFKLNSALGALAEELKADEGEGPSGSGLHGGRASNYMRPEELADDEPHPDMSEPGFDAEPEQPTAEIIQHMAALDFLRKFLDDVNDLLPPDKQQVKRILEDLEADIDNSDPAMTDDEVEASNIIHASLFDEANGLDEMIASLQSEPGVHNKHVLLAYLQRVYDSIETELMALQLQNLDGSGLHGGVRISKPAFIREHVSLINILKRGSKKQRKKEAADQSAELAKVRGGSLSVRVRQILTRSLRYIFANPAFFAEAAAALAVAISLERAAGSKDMLFGWFDAYLPAWFSSLLRVLNLTLGGTAWIYLIKLFFFPRQVPQIQPLPQQLPLPQNAPPEVPPPFAEQLLRKRRSGGMVGGGRLEDLEALIAKVGQEMAQRNKKAQEENTLGTVKELGSTHFKSMGDLITDFQKQFTFTRTEFMVLGELMGAFQKQFSPELATVPKRVEKIAKMFADASELIGQLEVLEAQLLADPDPMKQKVLDLLGQIHKRSTRLFDLEEGVGAELERFAFYIREQLMANPERVSFPPQQVRGRGMKGGGRKEALLEIMANYDAALGDRESVGFEAGKIGALTNFVREEFSSMGRLLITLQEHYEPELAAIPDQMAAVRKLFEEADATDERIVAMSKKLKPFKPGADARLQDYEALGARLVNIEANTRDAIGNILSSVLDALPATPKLMPKPSGPKPGGR